MKKVLFTKYSNERKPEYRIATSVIEENGRKSVLKKALNENGVDHIRHMFEVKERLSKLVIGFGWKIADCIMIDETTVDMEYIEGETLEQVFEEFVSKKEIASIINIARNISKKIYNHSDIVKFETSDKYISIFGDNYNNDWHAFELSNVDMIFSNIIICNGIYMLTDYEWVLDCQIPIEFILFRAVFHSVALSKLDDIEKNNVYECFNISSDDIGVFEDMERMFQAYVKGDSLDYRLLYEKIDNENIPVGLIDGNTVINKAYLYMDEQLISKTNSLQNDIKIECILNPSQAAIKLIMNNTNGIYKLISAKGYKNDNAYDMKIIYHNSDLIIENDYYFNNDSPCLVFENDYYKSVCVEYKVLNKCNGVLVNLINALIDLQSKSNELIESNKIKEAWESRSKEYEEAYKKLEIINEEHRRDCEQYKIAYEITSKELDEIHSRTIWKIGDRAKRVFRRKKD